MGEAYLSVSPQSYVDLVVPKVQQTAITFNYSHSIPYSPNSTGSDQATVWSTTFSFVPTMVEITMPTFSCTFSGVTPSYTQGQVVYINSGGTFTIISGTQSSGNYYRTINCYFTLSGSTLSIVASWTFKVSGHNFPFSISANGVVEASKT